MSDASLETMSDADRANLAALSLRLSSDPKTRRDFQRLIKSINPEFTSAELEVEDIGQRLKVAEGAAERLQKLESEIADRKARERWEEIRREPVKEGLIREDEIEGLEAYMKENGFTMTQHMLAARHRANEQKLAIPTAAALKPFDMNEKSIADAKKDPKAFLRNTALDHINKLRLHTAAA